MINSAFPQFWLHHFLFQRLHIFIMFPFSASHASWRFWSKLKTVIVPNQIQTRSARHMLHQVSVLPWRASDRYIKVASTTFWYLHFRAHRRQGYPEPVMPSGTQENCRLQWNYEVLTWQQLWLALCGQWWYQGPQVGGGQSGSVRAGRRLSGHLSWMWHHRPSCGCDWPPEPSCPGIDLHPNHTSQWDHFTETTAETTTAAGVNGRGMRT